MEVLNTHNNSFIMEKGVISQKLSVIISKHDLYQCAVKVGFYGTLEGSIIMTLHVSNANKRYLTKALYD